MIERTIAGSTIKRKASKDEPAFLIEQEDGTKVLKSRSELERAD
ncbi:HVA1 family protein [Agrobacterium tumefaciens]|nr:HVA1 family protein [Agrobacterium tumefaciens]NTE55958.1 HVA1 family protein [Agrobacterium tumefaciens]NTE74331.1 HVA1 family protein [Agrobacterium tumefaciens]